MTPLTPTHAERVSTPRISTTEYTERPGCLSRTASRAEAGTAAKTKKRGPHDNPPYQAHHFAYATINPATNNSISTTRWRSSRTSRRVPLPSQSRSPGVKKTSPRPNENRIESSPKSNG
jgi:hypothetical protein